MMNAELVKKYDIGKRTGINNKEGVYSFLKDLWNEEREIFIALYLDSKNNVICREIISIGTLNSSLVHPREVYRNAITLNANALILAHNHPSGDLQFSEEDRTVYKKLGDAGEVLGIKLYDFLVFNNKEIKSI